METKRTRSRPSKNLNNAIELLDLLSSSATSMNVMEISKSLNVTRTTTYAMLTTLMDKKLVERESDTGRYFIGYKVLEMAESYYHHYPFLYVVEKYVVALAQKWSLKINVSVLKEPAICLQLISKDPSFLIPRMVIGHITPAYATASGKILLSVLPDKELNDLLDSISMIRYTNKTLADKQALLNCLCEIRKLGYATEIDELMLQRSCVAAPIRDRSGAFIAAISFSGYTEDIKRLMPQLIIDIVNTGTQISAELGYSRMII